MLIDTKLRLPALGADTTVRPELLSRLDRVTEGRLAVVSAPTGFGKTTLLAQWAHTLLDRGETVGWLSAEASDNDMGRFLNYFVTALRRADPGFGTDLPGLLGSSPVLPVETVLSTLVNELSARAGDLFLVIDDFHHLDAPEITQFLEALIGYAPPGFHLVLGTRSQVPFQLVAMRARGQLVRIDEGELRFSLSQTERYLNQSRTLNMSTTEIVTLHHKTEGWIAGLHLASLSLGDPAGRSAFLSRFTGAEGDIADFLIHEVLNRQPSEMLDFLLCTAILERFSAPLADAVTGRRDCASLIARTEAANLFLVPLDRDRTWFRYHALFTDLLRGLLMQRDPERFAQLHVRAAQWLSGAGLTADAVQHALAAKDGDMAAALVEACCMPLIRQRNIAQVRNWLGRLPDKIIARRPRLQLAQVWILFHISQPREGTAILRRVRDVLKERDAAGSLTDDDVRELRAELLVLTAGLASAADHSRMAVRLTQNALRQIPAPMNFFRGVVGNVAGYSHYSLGDLQAGRLACLQARDCHSIGGHAFGVLYSDLILGLIDKAAGDLSGALDHFHRATMLARESDGPGSYSEAMVGIFEAEILYERNDLVSAERLFILHRPIIEECGLVVHDMSCKLLGARLAAAAGRVDAALAVLEAAERQGLRNRYRRLFSSAVHERIKLLLARGEVQYARLILSSRKIDEAWLAAPQSRRPACELEHLAYARVLIAEDRPEAALRLLDTLADRLKRDGRLRRLAPVRAVAAVAAYRAGNGMAALAAVSDAVSLSMRGGALRTLIEEGAPLTEVLAYARGKIPLWQSSDGGPGQFVESLLSGAAGDAGAPVHPAPSRHPELSPREAEIARLLGEGLGNREIGASLSMAPDTVKWHLKNIFGKLGAANRTHAVLRLQEIGLAATTRKGG